ncbi:hypothetical protein BDW74DRAFT_19914 [Aspergillus multicolor]|uniref:uncharacterized protein n=1 Tax=Aspergillus multicolor TaxID=41759 RepID=UPI003CCCEBD7
MRLKLLHAHLVLVLVLPLMLGEGMVVENAISTPSHHPTSASSRTRPGHLATCYSFPLLPSPYSFVGRPAYPFRRRTTSWRRLKRHSDNQRCSPLWVLQGRLVSNSQDRS